MMTSWIMGYSRANRPKRLAAERGSLIRRLNKPKTIDRLIDCLQFKVGVLKKKLVFVLKTMHEFYFNLCVCLAHVFCSFFTWFWSDDSKTKFLTLPLVLIIVEVLN